MPPEIEVVVICCRVFVIASVLLELYYYLVVIKKKVESFDILLNLHFFFNTKLHVVVSIRVSINISTDKVISMGINKILTIYIPSDDAH